MVTTIILLITIYILNIVDYFQTVYAIRRFGLDVELNPIMKLLFEHNCAWIVKLIMPIILLVSLGWLVKMERKCIWNVYALAIVYILVVMHNFMVFIRLDAF